MLEKIHLRQLWARFPSRTLAPALNHPSEAELLTFHNRPLTSSSPLTSTNLPLESRGSHDNEDRTLLEDGTDGTGRGESVDNKEESSSQPSPSWIGSWSACALRLLRFYFC